MSTCKGSNHREIIRLLCRRRPLVCRALFGRPMPDFLQLVSTLREQMNATLSRSDVLKPLAWLIGLLIAAAALLVFSGKAPDWLLVTIGVSLAASVAIYVVAYCYCLIKNPDALRSEKYSLHKMAIEHGIYGD